jgi:hypothetical protein
VLLSLCGSLPRGAQLQLLGLYVVDSSVEASLISFEGVVVVREGSEACVLVIKFAEDGSMGSGDAFPPLIFFGQHGLGCSRLVTRHVAGRRGAGQVASRVCRGGGASGRFGAWRDGAASGGGLGVVGLGFWRTEDTIQVLQYSV